MRTPQRRSRPSRRSFGARRSTLLKASAQRRHRLYNIWYQYSSRLRCDVVLPSDAHFDHFCCLEGDESIAGYQLNPTPLTFAGGDQLDEFKFDAQVTLREGRPQLHEIGRDENHLRALPRSQRKSEAAEAAGFDYVAVTPAYLADHAQLVANWRRALAFLAACRDLALDPACNELAMLFRRNAQATIEEALAASKPELQSVYVAALLRSLQEGWLHSDLHLKPLCLETRVWVAEVSHE